MKLSDFLNSIKDKTITAEDIQAISNEVDNIKANAVSRETLKLKETQAKFLDVEKQLKDFQGVKIDGELKKSFIEAGGNPEKFQSFKKINQNDNIKEINFKDMIEEFPSLGAGDKIKISEDDPFNQYNNLQNIQDTSSGDIKDTSNELDDMGYAKDSTIT